MNWLKAQLKVFRGQEGFTLSEVLVSLWLMSGLILLYLPAFRQALDQEEKLRTQTLHWQAFQQCVLADRQEDSELLEYLMDSYQIQAFTPSSRGYWIEFMDGEVLSLEIQASSP